MSNDPEAAWPLTQTETGYFASPAPPPAPSNLVPMSSLSGSCPPGSSRPVSDSKTMPWGVRVALLAIILGTAIPLTAIAASYSGFLGIAVVWVGITLVAVATLGRASR